MTRMRLLAAAVIVIGALAWLPAAASATGNQAAVTTQPAAAPIDQTGDTGGQAVDFRYSAVLLLPLVLLAGVAFAARTLTMDATPTTPRRPSKGSR